MFYVEPDKQFAVKQAMKDLIHIPFHFENGGTRVIYYAAEDYKVNDERMVDGK